MNHSGVSQAERTPPSAKAMECYGGHELRKHVSVWSHPSVRKMQKSSLPRNSDVETILLAKILTVASETGTAFILAVPSVLHA